MKKERDEKIKLLKSLAAGKVKLSEVFPDDIEIWLYEESTGIYSRGDQELAENEFRELRSKKDKNIICIEIRNPGGTADDKILFISPKEVDFDYKANGNNPPLDSKQVDKIITALHLT